MGGGGRGMGRKLIRWISQVRGAGWGGACCAL